MSPLLSEIGLPLDLIGAAMLALGLFRPTKPHHPGWQRSPWEASQDQAFGAVGFMFLATGFILQALSNLGVVHVRETSLVDAAPVIALASGVCVAYLLYGLVYIRRFPQECARMRGDQPPPQRQPRGWRFWDFPQE